MKEKRWALAASAHLFAWAGIAQPCALNGPQFLADRLCGNPCAPGTDQLPVSTRPGLGLEPDARAVDCLELVAAL